MLTPQKPRRHELVHRQLGNAIVAASTPTRHQDFGALFKHGSAHEPLKSVTMRPHLMAVLLCRHGKEAAEVFIDQAESTGAFQPPVDPVLLRDRFRNADFLMPLPGLLQQAGQQGDAWGAEPLDRVNLFELMHRCFLARSIFLGKYPSLIESASPGLAVRC